MVLCVYLSGKRNYEGICPFNCFILVHMMAYQNKLGFIPQIIDKPPMFQFHYIHQEGIALKELICIKILQYLPFSPCNHEKVRL